MRSVAGEHFRFVWNPDAAAFTQSGYSVAAAYPGNAYVDVIGLDAYDQTWATPTDTGQRLVLDRSCRASPAAQRVRFVARASPLALTEWGVIIRSDGHGLRRRSRTTSTRWSSWMQNPSNDVTYESYFDYDSGGLNSQITGGSFPNSLAAFSADLG